MKKEMLFVAIFHKNIYGVLFFMLFSFFYNTRYQ